MHRMSLALVMALPGAAVAQRAEPEQPRRPEEVLAAPPLHERPAADPAGEFRTADDLLRALERADADLVTLTASVVHDLEAGFEGDRQVRVGTMKFRVDPREPGRPPLRRFAVEFRKLYVGLRVEEDPRLYVFDGTILAEMFPKEKLCIRRQVVGPGEDFDPLRIGQGPLPIPIGQRREDILARFEAELLPPASGVAATDPTKLGEEERDRATQQARFVEGTQQLRLTPRPGADERADFAEVRIWYRRDRATGRLLPVMVRAVKATDGEERGDATTVQLLDIKVNDQAPISQGEFSTEIPSGWDGHLQDWREPEPAGGRKNSGGAGGR